MNGIPLVSQVLSVKDYFTNEPNLAFERQQQFTTQAVFVSQLKSLLFYMKGKKLESQITQIQFLSYPNSYVQLAYLAGLFSGPMIVGAMIDELGFSKLGIRSHSFAASWQHKAHNHGWFRSLKHIGTKGLPLFWSLTSAIVFAMLFSLFIVMILQMQQVEEAEFDEERPLLAQIEVEDDPESPMITAPGSPINVD